MLGVRFLGQPDRLPSLAGPEAGSVPGLANNVPGFAMGPSPERSVSGVPPGRYSVRLRARYGAVISEPSAEIVVDVP